MATKEVDEELQQEVPAVEEDNISKTQLEQRETSRGTSINRSKTMYRCVLVERVYDSGVPPLTVMGSEIVLCELGVEGSGCWGGSCCMFHTRGEIYSIHHSKSDSTG